MTRAIVLSLPLLLVSQSVWAANITGHSGLALAAVVASHAPTSVLSNHDKKIMARLFDGQSPTVPPNTTISITGDSITCFAGDVSINTFNCQLTFGTKTVTVTGSKGHEIFATLIEAGVPGSGAAGKIYEALKGLSCTIDPNEIEQNTGGGASCSFTPNP
jgi:hypothetical protein